MKTFFGIDEKKINKIIEEKKYKKNSNDLLKLLKDLNVNVKENLSQLSPKHDKFERHEKYLVDLLPN